MSEAKALLRRELKARRAAMAPEERRRLSAAIARRVEASRFYRDARIILGYFPVGEEVDLRGLYEAALAEGKTLAFPRCEGREMVFCAVSSLSELVPGRFSVPAPAPDAPALRAFEGALCLVPALGADRAGNRLGYGGGFYDRFLEQHPDLSCLCPLFDVLAGEPIPAEPFDRRVQSVMTEKREFDCDEG